MLEALVAQSVKRWPTDLALSGSNPAEGNIFNRKRCSIAHSLSLSNSHRPDMTEILLNRAYNRKLSTQPYIYVIANTFLTYELFLSCSEK